MTRIQQDSGPDTNRDIEQSDAQHGGRTVRTVQLTLPDAPDAPVRSRSGPVSLPATTHSYLARAAESLQEAILTSDVPTRYACAHVAALRSTAALLAARAAPTPTRRRQRSAWDLLVRVAPELSEWASFFAAGAAKRAAAEAGSTRAVTEREADDLVRDSDRFLAVVESLLGLVPHTALGGRLAVPAVGIVEQAGVA